MIDWHDVKSETPNTDTRCLVKISRKDGTKFIDMETTVTEAKFIRRGYDSDGDGFLVCELFQPIPEGFIRGDKFKRDDIGMRITHWAFVNYPQGRSDAI